MTQRSMVVYRASGLEGPESTDFGSFSNYKPNRTGSDLARVPGPIWHW
jgi:hypothetical protein